MNFHTRKYVIISFMVLVSIVYAIRLFYMQVIDDTWELRAAEIAEKRKEITPPRGVIYDRKGRKIVANRTYYNLMMIEDKIKNLDTVAFAKLIGWTVEDVRKRFKAIRYEQGTYYNRNTKKRTSNYRSDREYPFIKEMALEEVVRIAPYLDKFPGFYEDVTSMRSYPFANASNIVGYLSEVTQEEIDEDAFYRPGNNIGRAGIERFYEDQLRGVKGIRYVVTSAMNNAIEPFANKKYDTLARQGASLHMGVDIKLQAYGERLMKNKRGCIVAIEPSTGEILALVSSPSYDPNLLIGKKNIAKHYSRLVFDKSKPLYPRPLAAEYPPGSTFKLINSLIGLQEGVITPESGFPCNKSIVGCHGHGSAGNLPDGIKHSCNPYFYAVTRRIIQQGKRKKLEEDAELGLNRWAKYMRSFGLGVKLDADITGLRAGLIPNSTFYDKWYGHHMWAFSTIRSISIGQGEVMLTPLQMANVAAIIANKGWYITPHFVRSISKKGPLPQYRKKHYTMVDAKHFDVVIEGMRRVVYVGGGTGKRARLKDIIVCGKTGTVQNPHGDDHSTFIAFAPMEKPKIAVAVFIENAGGGGGRWAAPTSALIIEKYLTGKVSDTERENTILNARFTYKDR
jgi:penicillin-binding protein 2